MADYSGNDLKYKDYGHGAKVNNVISIDKSTLATGGIVAGSIHVPAEIKKVVKTVVYELQASNHFATVDSGLSLGDLREFLSLLEDDSVSDSAAVRISNGNLTVLEKK